MRSRTSPCQSLWRGHTVHRAPVCVGTPASPCVGQNPRPLRRAGRGHPSGHLDRRLELSPASPARPATAQDHQRRRPASRPQRCKPWRAAPSAALGLRAMSRRSALPCAPASLGGGRSALRGHELLQHRLPALAAGWTNREPLADGAGLQIALRPMPPPAPCSFLCRAASPGSPKQAKTTAVLARGVVGQRIDGGVPAMGSRCGARRCTRPKAPVKKKKARKVGCPWRHGEKAPARLQHEIGDRAVVLVLSTGCGSTSA